MTTPLLVLTLPLELSPLLELPVDPLGMVPSITELNDVPCFAHRNSLSALSQSLLVAANGERRGISSTDFKLTPRRYWQSPGGRRYPVAWALRYGDLRLEIRPRMDNQAYTRGIPYWEGAVEVSGRDSGAPVAGLGYLEMSGY